MGEGRDRVTGRADGGPDSEFMQVHEVMQKTRLARSTVYHLLATNVIRSAKFGRARRALRTDVERYIREGLAAAEKGG